MQGFLCFQVPSTHSTVSLSSDSESSLNGVPSGEDQSDCQVLSPPKSSKIPDEDESLDKTLMKSVAESPSKKRLKSNSPKQGKNVEDQISLKKKKLDKPKHKPKEEGNTEALVENFGFLITMFRDFFKREIWFRKLWRCGSCRGRSIRQAC